MISLSFLILILLSILNAVLNISSKKALSLEVNLSLVIVLWFEWLKIIISSQLIKNNFQNILLSIHNPTLVNKLPFSVNLNIKWESGAIALKSYLAGKSNHLPLMGRLENKED